MSHTAAARAATYMYPAGCASDPAYGFGLARCVVVAIQLSGNGLDGTLAAELSELTELQLLVLDGNRLRGRLFDGVETAVEGDEGADEQGADPLPALRTLNVADNELVGAIPPWLSQHGALRRIELDGNAFDYFDPDDDLHAADADSILQLVRRCQQRGLVCAGLPPESCAAFGRRFVVRTDDPETCLLCTSPVAPLVGMGALFLLSHCALAGYVRLINRHPDAMKRWVSTSTLAIDHLQTLSIVGNLQLHWPPAVQAATATFSFNMFEMVSAIRPECLLVDVNVSSFYFFNIVTASAILATLAGLGLLK